MKDRFLNHSCTASSQFDFLDFFSIILINKVSKKEVKINCCLNFPAR